jgi:hypothetical protein
MGADCLTIKLFGKEFRIEEKQATESVTRYRSGRNMFSSVFTLARDCSLKVLIID